MVHKSVDFYMVYFRGEDSWQFDEVVVAGNASRPAQTNVKIRIHSVFAVWEITCFSTCRSS